MKFLQVISSCPPSEKMFSLMKYPTTANTQTDTWTHNPTDRYFPEIVKSCSEHLKTFKSIKNQKSKICTKPILCSTYIEESIKQQPNKSNFTVTTSDKFSGA